MEEESVFENINPSTILNYILAITVVVMISLLFISIYEIVSAKKGCDKLDGNYTLKSLNHFCNDKPFYKYSNGEWYWNKNYTIQMDLNKFG